MVKVYVPADALSNGEDKKQKYIGVNGKGILVQTDKTIEVPAEFAEVIERSKMFEANGKAFAEQQASTE